MMNLSKTLRRAATLALAIGGLAVAPASAAAQPVLVVSDGGFGNYYPEILRAEGLNAFDVANSGALNAGSLAPYDVVVLAAGRRVGGRRPPRSATGSRAAAT